MQYKEVYPFTDNVISVGGYKRLEVSEVSSIKRPAAFDISKVRADDASVLDIEFGTAFGPLIYAMDMHGVVLIRVKQNH